MVEGISLLVTDIDNTLFDWVEAWYRSFSAMLDETVRLTGIPREQLIPEIKAVHQSHGTSEYAFLLNELPSLRRVLGDAPVLQALAPAIAAFRRARDDHLQLYPGVAETLKKVKGAGTIIVGYTESMEPYTVYRLKYLGLDGLLDILFTPQGHEIPTDIDPEWFEHHRFFGIRYRAPKRGILRAVTSSQILPSFWR
jgi:phosphoglycolate phosphatase